MRQPGLRLPRHQRDRHGPDRRASIEAAARAVPGVLDILTHENMHGEVREAGFFAGGGYAGSTMRPLEIDRIQHDGQIVAVVLADTFEAAREAAYRVQDRLCRGDSPRAGFGSRGRRAGSAAKALARAMRMPAVGDAEAAFAAAAVQIEADYATPDPAPQPDRAVHHDRGLGQRQADDL